MTIQRYDPFDGGLGFSLATRVGSLVYTSGMAGFDPETAAPPDDLEDEIRLVFVNLGNILEGIGTSLEYVMDETVFLVGEPATVYPVLAKVRAEVFGDHLPASTAVFVESLAEPRFRCEIKVVAAMPD